MKRSRGGPCGRGSVVVSTDNESPHIDPMVTSVLAQTTKKGRILGAVLVARSPTVATAARARTKVAPSPSRTA